MRRRRHDRRRIGTGTIINGQTTDGDGEEKGNCFTPLFFTAGRMRDRERERACVWEWNVEMCPIRGKKIETSSWKNVIFDNGPNGSNDLLLVTQAT